MLNLLTVRYWTKKRASVMISIIINSSINWTITCYMYFKIFQWRVMTAFPSAPLVCWWLRCPRARRPSSRARTRRPWCRRRAAASGSSRSLCLPSSPVRRRSVSSTFPPPRTSTIYGCLPGMPSPSSWSSGLVFGVHIFNDLNFYVCKADEYWISPSIISW